MEPENALADDVVVTGTHHPLNDDQETNRHGLIRVRREVYLDQYDREELLSDLPDDESGHTKRNVRFINLRLLESDPVDENEKYECDNQTLEPLDTWVCLLDLYVDELQVARSVKSRLIRSNKVSTNWEYDHKDSSIQKARIGAQGQTHQEAVQNAVEEMITMTTEKIEDEKEAQERLDSVVGDVDDEIESIDWSEVPDFSEMSRQ